MAHPPTDIETFWQTYLASLPPGAAHPAGYTAWGFGHTAADAAELGALVVRGVKTATTSLLWAYAAEEPLPQVGEFSIILDGADAPLCVIETTEVQMKAYRDVDDRFAYDEGEGDRSLAYWRDVHWRYFGEECAEIGRAPDPEMPVVCERFQVVFKPEEPAA